jgi:hypothetical protein
MELVMSFQNRTENIRNIGITGIVLIWTPKPLALKGPHAPDDGIILRTFLQ